MRISRADTSSIFVAALERWRESGVAPDAIVASHRTDGRVARAHCVPIRRLRGTRAPAVRTTRQASSAVSGRRLRKLDVFWANSHRALRPIGRHYTVLELSEVRQQRLPFFRSNESAIDDEPVRGENRRQIGRWIQPSSTPELGVIVVDYLFECRRGVVVEVRSRPADAA